MGEPLRIIIKNKTASWNEIIRATAKHWAVKKAIFDEWKKLVVHAEYIYGNTTPTSWPYSNPVSIAFVCRFKYKRKYDVDNCCVKPIIDALVDKRILKDDNYEYVKSINIAIEVGCKANEVEIIINELIK